MAYQKVAALSFAITLLGMSAQLSHGQLMPEDRPTAPLRASEQQGGVARQPGKIVEEIACGLMCSLSGSQITGTIDSSMAGQLNALIDRVRQRAAKENTAGYESFKFGGGTMDLNSVGGSVSAGMAVGRILRKHRIKVNVMWDSVCYSSCVVVLAGAVGRSIYGGKIGIHRPYLSNVPNEISPEKVRETYQRMLQEMRAYFREMNVSEQLADAMLRTEPHNMRLLSEAALNNFGLTETDPIEQETDDLEQARSYGLDRMEYMRRKSLIERTCPPWTQGVDANSACERRIMKTGK